MAQRRKSIRHKSLRRNNRTTLKRGGVKENTKITHYFKPTKTGPPDKLKNNSQTPGVFYNVPNYRASMSKKQKREIETKIEKNLETYSKDNGIPIPDSYPSDNRNIRNI